MPARFATAFCMPTHFPAARGPASVCANAKVPAFDAPLPTAIATRQYIYVRGPESAQATSAIAATEKPIPIAHLRTTVGLPPPRMLRSAIQPVATDVIESTM